MQRRFRAVDHRELGAQIRKADVSVRPGVRPELGGSQAWSRIGVGVRLSCSVCDLHPLAYWHEPRCQAPFN
jgi:hypothetical protein